jgi:hypothetical protein
MVRKRTKKVTSDSDEEQDESEINEEDSGSESEQEDADPESSSDISEPKKTRVTRESEEDSGSQVSEESEKKRLSGESDEEDSGSQVSQERKKRVNEESDEESEQSEEESKISKGRGRRQTGGITVKKIKTVVLPRELKPELEDLLIQDPEEPDDIFKMRSEYTLMIRELEPPYSNLKSDQKVLLGRIIINGARYGLSYSKQIDAIVERINELIQKKE